MAMQDILKAKSYELYTRYMAFEWQAVHGFQNASTMIGYLTDHGVQHCRNVKNILCTLLPEDVKQSLTPEEIFLLLCAVDFHDVGLLYEKREHEPWKEVRRDHADRSYDYIHEFYTDWGFNRFEAYALKNICLGHGGALYELPEELYIHQDRVRICFLSALLCLADALDVDYTRVSKYIQHLKKIPDDSLRHWIKHEEIGGVRIDPRSRTITIYAMPRNQETRQILKELAEVKIQKDLDFVRPVLEQYGLYYRWIEMRYLDFGQKRVMSNSPDKRV